MPETPLDNSKTPILKTVWTASAAIMIFGVVSLFGVEEISEEGVKDLESFLKKGGGIIWFQGDSSVENFYLDLFSRLDFPRQENLVNSGGGVFNIEVISDQSYLLKDLQKRTIEKMTKGLILKSFSKQIYEFDKDKKNKNNLIKSVFNFHKNFQLTESKNGIIIKNNKNNKKVEISISNIKNLFK